MTGIASASRQDGTGTQPRTFLIKHPSPFLDDRRTHWRWKGQGQLTLEDDLVTLTGKRTRPFWFAAPQAVTFRRELIRDVQRDGKTLTCVVDLVDRTPEPLVLEFATEAEAEQVAAAWPRALSQELRDRRIFAEQLTRAGVRPRATPALIGLCVLAFIAIAIGGISPLSPDGLKMIAWGTNFGPLTLHGEPWRLASSMFLHFGLLHIALNMLSLWNIGGVVERLLGTGRFVALYGLAGISGSLASVAWNPWVNSAGASGAIFGVMGALLALMLHRKTRIPPTVAKALRSSSLVFIAYNVFFGLSHAGIDNAAHLGGLVSGFGLGWVLARPLGAEPEPGLDRSMVTTAALSVLLLAGAFSFLQLKVGERVALRAELQPVYELEAEALGVMDELEKKRATRRLTDPQWAQDSLAQVKPLWEQANEIAGQLRASAAGPRRTALDAMQRYLQLQVLHAELSAEAVLNKDPEKLAWAQETERKLTQVAAEARANLGFPAN